MPKRWTVQRPGFQLISFYSPETLPSGPIALKMLHGGKPSGLFILDTWIETDEQITEALRQKFFLSEVDFIEM